MLIKINPFFIWLSLKRTRHTQLKNKMRERERERKITGFYQLLRRQGFHPTLFHFLKKNIMSVDLSCIILMIFFLCRIANVHKFSANGKCVINHNPPKNRLRNVKWKINCMRHRGKNIKRNFTKKKICTWIRIKVQSCWNKTVEQIINKIIPKPINLIWIFRSRHIR